MESVNINLDHIECEYARITPDTGALADTLDAPGTNANYNFKFKFDFNANTADSSREVLTYSIAISLVHLPAQTVLCECKTASTYSVYSKSLEYGYKIWMMYKFINRASGHLRGVWRYRFRETTFENRLAPIGYGTFFRDEKTINELIQKSWK